MSSWDGNTDDANAELSLGALPRKDDDEEVGSGRACGTVSCNDDSDESREECGGSACRAECTGTSPSLSPDAVKDEIVG